MDDDTTAAAWDQQQQEERELKALEARHHVLRAELQQMIADSDTRMQNLNNLFKPRKS